MFLSLTYNNEMSEYNFARLYLVPNRVKNKWGKKNKHQFINKMSFEECNIFSHFQTAAAASDLKQRNTSTK